MNLIDLINPNYLTEEVFDPRYENSIFCNLKKMSPKPKGARMEMIVRDILTHMGYTVESPTSTDHDVIASGHKYEIKGSTLAKNTINFSFLQIRPEQDYESLIFTMFYPDELVMMVMDKPTIIKNIEKGIFKSQHGGKKGNSKTYVYYGNKETLQEIGATIFGN